MPTPEIGNRRENEEEGKTRGKKRAIQRSLSRSVPALVRYVLRSSCGPVFTLITIPIHKSFMAHLTADTSLLESRVPNTCHVQAEFDELFQLVIELSDVSCERHFST